VAVLCRALGVNRTSFHDWERRAPSDRALSDAWLTEKIKQIHAASDGTYGGLDRGGMHAEPRGVLADREQAARAEALEMAREAVCAAQPEHDPVGERLAVAGAVPGLGELGGCLGVGVLIEEAVEKRERVGVCRSQVPRARRDRHCEAGGLAAAEADVQVDLVGLVERDILDQQPRDPFALALRGGGVRPHRGEVRGELADLRLVLLGERGSCGGGRGSYSSWAACRARSASFQSASSVSATSRLSGSTER